MKLKNFIDKIMERELPIDKLSIYDIIITHLSKLSEGYSIEKKFVELGSKLEDIKERISRGEDIYAISRELGGLWEEIDKLYKDLCDEIEKKYGRK